MCRCRGALAPGAEHDRHAVVRFAVAFLAFLVLVPVLAAADPPSVVGRLNLAEGAVSFRPGSLDEWAPAVLNYPLTSGDHVWADAGSRAELHVGSTAVRLDGETEISFLNLDEDVVQVGISEGRVNVRLRRLDPGDAFEIDTPNSVFTMLEPGSYSISVQGDEGSSLTVWKGRAEAAAAGNDFTVPAGQTANVSGSGSVAYYTQPAGLPGGWDSWCASRDSREEQFASARYVPREMIGIEDLDENGSWIVMAGYGPVWAPRARRTGMGALQVRALGLGGSLGVDLDRRRPVGLRSVSLRALGVRGRTVGLDTGRGGRASRVCACARRVHWRRPG